jgi:hypothetical protein
VKTTGPPPGSAPVAYLICFDRPYRHVRHYAGHAPKGLRARLAQHRAGTGAVLLAVLNEAGIGWHVACWWPDPDGGIERRLKDGQNLPRVCPECSPGNKRALDPVPKGLRRPRSAGWMANPGHRVKPVY